MTDSKMDLPKFINDECGCSEFEYTPDEGTIVHTEGSIKQLCAPIRSHENGLPEWLKNSADAYARNDASSSQRIIILIFDSERKDKPSSISCLDLVGITSEEIEKYFRVWADPEAADRGDKSGDIQGGHGNGGKCYMVQMFDEFAYVHTVKKGRGNLYGVRSGSVHFGYVPNPENGRNFIVENLKDELNEVLGQFRCSIETLPHAAKEALNSIDGFSLFTGFGPKGYGNKIPVKRLLRHLCENPQSLRTIQTCKVFLIVNGKLQLAKKPLILPEITPIKGTKGAREIEIPSKLTDPLYDKTISTTENGKFHRGKLALFTSEKSMRYSLKSRHSIRYVSEKIGDFGFVPVVNLGVQSPYQNHIYGICSLEALEQYKLNQRAELADSPLTRVVQEFIREEVQKYAREFEKRDEKVYDKEEKQAISKINEALDRWKNKFLNEMMQGVWGSGSMTSSQDRSHLPIGEVARIELDLTHCLAGKGVSLRPTLHFFDQEGRRIRPSPHKWGSEDTNVAMVNDLGIIETFSYGPTQIYAETIEGNVRSNLAPLEVVHIKDIKIFPESVELPEGSRQRFEAACTLDDGRKTSEVFLIWDEDDPSIARVSTAGFVYGFNKGETSVIAWDDNCSPDKRAIVKVVSGTGGGKGDKRGKGYPLVLVSGEIDPDPQTGEYVFLSKDDPPVHQRPEDSDHNIWWINSASPLAALYLDKEKGYGYGSREWRIYHLERYVDIIVQIMLVHSQQDGEALNVNEWIREWMQRVSDLLPTICNELHDFITSGQLTFV